jgi:hypothetical protein
MHYVTRQGRRIAVETVETGVIPNRRRQVDPFVKVPLQWAVAAAKATRTRKALVWLLLLYEAWKAKGVPFPLSNEKLARYGVSRETKRRALAEIEASGLCTVQRQHGRAPVVTLPARYTASVSETNCL